METELQLLDSAASPRTAKLKSPSSSVGSIHEYTSLKDILLGLDSPTAALGGIGSCSRGSRAGSGIDVAGHGGFDSSAICIRNQLVKHAASAYLQSAAILATRDRSCLTRFWHSARRTCTRPAGGTACAADPFEALARFVERAVRGVCAFLAGVVGGVRASTARMAIAS
ncbi:uncharacterized protein LOC109713425 [Ananas comosus]|uniref:Uncharacterized protein LOC109713425 n=1 Tax=Ananas comosus TaxID=4615 RepID=A0A6P5FAX2_ANACO|nr:uncharacterized protein LOC109713425 [Ananas comosus]